MNNSSIGVRYAKALISRSLDKNCAAEVMGDMEFFLQIYNNFPDFIRMLKTPGVRLNKKKELFTALFLNRVNETSFAFFMLVLENKREDYLNDMARDFLDLYHTHTGISSASLVTAIPLSATDAQQMKENIEKWFNTKVEVNQKVNPDIMGGFIVRVDDRLLDASISTKLKRLKKILIQSEG